MPNAFKEVSEEVFYGDLRDITARIYDNGAIEIEWYQSTECLIPEKLISKEDYDDERSDEDIDTMLENMFSFDFNKKKRFN